jgi:hypothetical protein
MLGTITWSPVGQRASERLVDTEEASVFWTIVLAIPINNVWYKECRSSTAEIQYREYIQVYMRP